MGQKAPPGAVAYMVGTTAAAMTAGFWSAAASGFPAGEFPTFLVLTILGSLSHLYPIRSVQGQAQYVLANTFLFAAVLLLSSGWLVLLSVGTWVPTIVRRYRQGKRHWFLVAAANAGQGLLAALAAHYLLGGIFQAEALSWPLTGRLVLAVLGFVLLQTTWVFFSIHLFHRVPLRSIDLWNQDAFLSDLVLLCLGAVLAILWQVHPTLLILIAFPVAFAYHLMRGVQLIRLAEVDAKTGLYNSRRFEELFSRALTSARLLRRPLALVFLDLDYLRDVNNTYGHLAGDEVIKEVARRIRSSIRSGDFAARFGGEEFVLLLPGTEVQEAQWVAERIRRAVADAPVDVGDGQQVFCSISGGVAAFPRHGSSMAELTAAADAALYRAKGEGRNRVLAAPGPPSHRAGASVDAAPESPRHGCGPMAATAAAEPPAASAAAAVPPAAATAASAAAAVSRLPSAGTLASWANHESCAAVLEPAVPGKRTARSRPRSQESQEGGAVPTSRTRAALAAPLGVGGLLALLLVVLLPQGGPADAGLLLGLCAASFAAEYFKINLLSYGENRTTVSLGVAVTMAAAATLGAAGAVAVNVANVLALVVQNRGRRPLITLANLAILVLSALVGATSYRWVIRLSTGLDLWQLAAAAVGGTLYFIVDVGLVAALISYRQRLALREVWQQHSAWMGPNFIFTAACGALLGGAFQTLGWVALPLFFLPLLVMRHTFQAYMRRSTEAYEATERARRTLEEAHRVQKAAVDRLIDILATVIDARDASVYGHSQQVARYAVALGQELQVPDRELDAIRQAALLHDLGKLGIPEAILHKPARLTPAEWEVVKQHPDIGAGILEGIPGLTPIARMVREHHEKYNGRGYPQGLKGEEISLGARIIALADAVDSMLSDRPYSRGKPLSWVVAEVERCAGGHFDPQVAAAFQRLTRSLPPEFFVNSAVVAAADHLAAGGTAKGRSKGVDPQAADGR